MNKVILIFLMFLAVACGAAPNQDLQPVKTEDMPEKRMVKPKLIWNSSNIIEKSQKPVFLYFSMTKCKSCKEMQNVFKDEELILNLQNFVPIKLFEKDSRFEELVDKYNISVVPSIVILSSNKDKDLIGGISGYVEPQDLVLYVKLAYDTNKLFLIKEGANQILNIL